MSDQFAIFSVVLLVVAVLIFAWALDSYACSDIGKPRNSDAVDFGMDNYPEAPRHRIGHDAYSQPSWEAERCAEQEWGTYLDQVHHHHQH